MYIANFAVYEIEDDVLANLQEFTFANSLYWAMVEGYASEMCAKRAAMENATNNAGDMITKLTMTYNRGRQAVITNELSKWDACVYIKIMLLTRCYSRHYHWCFCSVNRSTDSERQSLCNKYNKSFTHTRTITLDTYA